MAPVHGDDDISAGRSAESRSDEVIGSDPDVVDRIAALAERHLAAGVTPVFPIAVPEPLVAALLARQETVSVILAAAPASHFGVDPGRLGWLRADGRLARAPAQVGDLLLTFGDPEAFGFELARMSLKRGGRRIAFDSPFGFTEPGSLSSLLASRSWRGANRKLGRLARNVILSGRLGPFGPILLRTHRYLRKTTETRRYARAFAPLADTILKMPVSGRSIPGRLALVTGSLGPGGAERQVANTLLGLLDRGARDVHLIAEKLSPPPNDFYLKELQGLEGLTIAEIGAVSTPGDAGMLTLLQITRYAPVAFRTEILKLIEVFRHLRPEVVHIWQDGPCVKAGIAAALAGVDRIVLNWRTLSPIMSGIYHPSYRSIIRALAARDNVVMLNNSAAGARSYADWLAFDPRNIRVIRNGMDFARWSPQDPDAVRAYRDSLGLPAVAPVVGTIIRFGEEKRPKLWAETAAKVAKRRPDVHFLMIGDGPLRDGVRDAVAAWGLERRIHMPGRMANPAMALAVMDIFLLTSLYEGLPNVLLEAGAMGVPIVSTDVGGVRETFIHGETGYAVASSRTGALADKVLYLLEQETWRQDARRLAPIWIRKRFALTRMIDETLDAYGAGVAEADGLKRRCVA